MVVFLNRTIQVGAVFKNGAVIPRWFRYRGRKIEIREITYSWKKRDGARTVHCFSVTDGINLYALAFRPEGLSWNLEAVEDS